MHAYLPLLPVVLMLLAYALRKFTPPGAFFHSPQGLALMTGLSTVIGGVAQAIKDQGLTKGVVIAALTSGILSLIGAANPSMGKSTAKLMGFLFITAVLASGCNWTPIDSHTGLTLVLVAGCFVTLFMRSRWAKLAGLAFAIAASGCATVATPPNATLAQKLQADEALVLKIVADVGTKCGPKFASFGKTVSGIVAIASTPADVLSDVMEAAALIPDLANDYQALTCVISTTGADLKAAKPKQAAMLLQMVAEIQRREFEFLAQAFERLRRFVAIADICTVAPDRDQERPACRELRVRGVPETVP